MLENRVKELMAPYAGCRWLCGFSGGTDSTALLLLLHKAADALHSPLAAVHFEHGLRGGESLNDAAFCRQFAGARQISFREIALQVRENRCRGEGIEAAARRLRMQAWETLASAPGIVVVLAHHADDAAENLFLRMARGGNLSGLLSPGFRTVIGEVTYLRPLLEFTKPELESYLRSCGVTEYCTDSSNADCRFARNRIRNRVIPELKKIHSGSTEGIRSSLRNLRCDEDFLEHAAREAFAPQRGKKAIALTFWAALHPALQVRCLRLFLMAQGYSSFLPDGAFLRRFAEMLQKGTGKIPLEKTFLAAQGGMLSLENPVRQPFLWRWHEKPDIRLGTWHFQAELCSGMPEKSMQTASAFYFDAEKLPAELILRPRRQGDTLETFDHRNVPLKKLFTNAKLPAVQRTAPLVIETQTSGILGVLLLRRGASAPVTNSTKNILRISVE